MGRHSEFTDERALIIIDGLTRGVPLTRICRENEFGVQTVYDWLAAHEGFAVAYARARGAGFDAIADQTLEIADDGTNDYMETKDGPAYNAEHVQRSKLRVETRLKLLAKWDPKRYGDKQQVEHSGQIGLAEMVLNSMKDREGK
jgi:hypothetical protein